MFLSAGRLSAAFAAKNRVTTSSVITRIVADIIL